MAAPKHEKLIGITVNQHISLQQRHHPDAKGEFSQLLTEIIVAAKVIRNKVTLAGIAEVVGSAGEQNVQGETQQILDQLANEIMIKRLFNSGVVCMVVSEENEQPLYCPDEHLENARYAVAMDPLDGSSNIACNIPIGTIFGIWKRDGDLKKHPGPELFQGRKQVAAGYVLYGPSSMLVYTTGTGVHGFTYDPSVGEFILTHEYMKFPPKSKCYSVNEAYWHNWDAGVQNFVSWIKTPEKAAGRPYAGRYVGSLIADFHRNLLYGGIFLYPKDKSSSQGKLRLLYEAAPLSFIAEQAGGLGSTGDENILDIIPSSLHQRVALYIGNASDVKVAEDFLSAKRTK